MLRNQNNFSLWCAKMILYQSGLSCKEKLLPNFFILWLFDHKQCDTTQRKSLMLQQRFWKLLFLSTIFSDDIFFQPTCAIHVNMFYVMQHFKVLTPKHTIQGYTNIIHQNIISTPVSTLSNKVIRFSKIRIKHLCWR